MSTWRATARFFRALDAPSSPYPLAVFRILLFAGLLLHFGPGLFRVEAGYGSQALIQSSLSLSRVEEWLALAPWLRAALAWTVLAGLFAALGGVAFRASAVVAGLGCYLFDRLNSLYTGTLALGLAWPACALLVLAGGGAQVLSLRPTQGPSTRYYRALIALHLWSAVFWSGLEKIASGWLDGGPLITLLHYPVGFYLRPWVVATGGGPAWLGLFFSYCTLLVEILAPLSLCHERTRPYGCGALLFFFVAIGLTLEVPPLFVLLYLGAVAVTVDDATLAAMRRWSQRARAERVTVALGIFALVSAFLAAGCADKPAPGHSPDAERSVAERTELAGEIPLSAPLAGSECVGGGIEACDPHDHGCRAQVFELVRCLTGDRRPLRLPRVEFIDGEEMQRRVSLRSDPDPTRSKLRERALSWFELLPPTPPVSGEPPLGLYSRAERRIFLLEATERSPARADFFTLAHELVHAAQGAGSEDSSGRQYLDEELAERAALEGEARYYELWIRGLVDGFLTDEFRRDFVGQPEAAERAVLAAPFPLLRTQELFHTPVGTRYAALERQRRPGLFAAHTEAPHRATSVLLAVTERNTPWPYGSPEPDNLARDGVQPAHSDRLGLWVVRSYLARATGSATTAARVVEGLRGDAFHVYLSNAGNIAVWTWAFATVADRAAAAATLEPFLNRARVSLEPRNTILSLITRPPFGASSAFDGPERASGEHGGRRHIGP